MMPINKGSSQSLNWQQMPILRTLVFVQIGIAIIFSIIATFIAIYYVNDRSTSVLNSRKLDLIRIMSPNQERIRLWANLEMNEALSISLQEIRKIDFIKGVEVWHLTNDQFNDIKSEKYKLIIPEKIDPNLPYYLVFRIDQNFDASILSTLLIPLIVFLFAFTLIYFSIVFIMKKIFKPLSLLISNDLESDQANKSIDIEATGEIAALISRIQKSQQDKIQLESEKNNFKLATQLSHDIRSPLEVLKGLKDEMASFPDSSRKRIQLSINRIEEITFNLLRTHKQSIGSDSYLLTEELLSLITSVVTEKSIEYRNHTGIDILEVLDSNSYGLFSKVQRSALKSIISNLINNGIESFSGMPGVISISLISRDDKNVIKINDNGTGVPPEVRNKIFTKGFTTKRTGNGLGLYNAKQDIEAVGGTIEFESEIGKGTSFTITLPKSEKPSSFIASIDAYKYERIIVLDDDPAFHEVWNKRLEGLESKVEHIHSVEEMLTKYQALHPKILLLSDFELMDKQYDGIDTILKLNHAEHSVLVTARNEEHAIQDRCLKAGIKLLPKSLVNYVKVVATLSESSPDSSPEASKLRSASMLGCDSAVHKSEVSKFSHVEGTHGREWGPNNEYGDHAENRSSDDQDDQNKKPIVVLIDDDRLVHLNWSSHCKKNGLQFHGFKSIAQFIAFSSEIAKGSQIYIDSNLEDGIKGEVESEKIYHLGYFNLYIATGYHKDSIDKPHWIKEIYSKSPENIS